MSKLEVSEKELTTLKVGKIGCAEENEKRMIRQRCVELALERCRPEEDVIKMAKCFSDFIIG